MLYVDVTTAVNWIGAPTGIPRVEKELAKALLQHPNVQFVKWNSHRSDFEVIERNILLKSSGSNNYNDSVNSRLTFYKYKAYSIFDRKAPALLMEILKLRRVFFEDFLSSIPQIFGLLFSISFRLIKFLFVTMSKIFGMKKSKLSKYFVKMERTYSIDWQANDVLLCVGAFWGYEGFDSYIVDLKNRFQIQFQALVYDIIPITHPHTYGFGFSKVFYRYMKSALWSADRIFSISSYVAKDVERFIEVSGWPVKSVLPIELSIGEAFSDDDEGNSMVSNRPFVLMVGTLEFRKRPALMLDVWRALIGRMGEECPDLIFVGREGYNNGLLQQQVNSDPRLLGRVQLRHGISDHELHSLYKNCLFSVYPSIAEGWGLPISESLFYGKVPVFSNNTSLMEASKGFGALVEPDTEAQWIVVVDQLINSNDYRRALELKIKEEYRFKTWSQYGEELMKEVTGCL